MQIPTHPSLSRLATTPVLALLVSAAVAVMLAASASSGLSHYLGDTDDAMRLVLFRDLLAGRSAWYDLHVARIQPPAGTEIHWSRLVDGGLAGLNWLFGRVLPPDRAEWATRLTWPLLWVLPAVWPVLALARRLGGQPAVWLAALVLVISLPLFGQWRPGRIDHHDIQIALCLITLAGAAAADRRGALAAGAASALGLAVGLEAVPFLAVIGASFGVRLLVQPRASGPAVRRYGLALAGVATAAYLVQTPPARWSVAACDALGLNLWAAAVVGGLALALAARLTQDRPLAPRLFGLAAAAGAAVAVFLAIDPACIAGPTAHLDPRVRPIWFDFVIEMRPLVLGFIPSRPDGVVAPMVMMALGTAGWLWLGRRAEARTATWLLVGAVFFLGVVMGLKVARLAHYPAWFAVPLFAAALADLGSRLTRLKLLVPVFLACALSPVAVARSIEATGVWDRAKVERPRPADHCLLIASYRQLAALPPGLVLSEIDIGPYVLATSGHSVMSAPYHRATDGVLAAHAILAAGPGPDEAAARRSGVDYVVDCPARADRMTHSTLPATSLQARLDRGEAPAWLTPLSPPKAPLQIYRVR